MYYDFDGKEITTDEWAALFSRREYSRVALDTDDSAGIQISTVWLGIDHSFGSGPVEIFETLVSCSENSEIYMARYGTAEQAREGHLWCCLKFLEQSQSSFLE